MVSILDGRKSGDTLFVMYMDEDSQVEYAKEFCKENNLTPETVSIKIIKKNDEKEKYCVVTVK